MSGLINTVLLDKIPIQIARRIEESDAIYEPTLVRHMDMATREMMIELRGWLLGETLPEKTIQYPADWIQAFKARFWRWFPKWARERWPIKYTVHRISIHVIYPDFKPKLFELDERSIVKINIFDGGFISPIWEGTRISPGHSCCLQRQSKATANSWR